MNHAKRRYDMRPFSARRALPLCVVLFLGSLTVAHDEAKRPLKPEDLQRLESFWQTAISIDGQLLAYELQRSVVSGVSETRDALHSLQRREIWIVPIAGGDPKMIAGG